MNVIRSHLHDVYTEVVNKVALSAEDDKRVIIRECKPGPFFPNPGFGFPGIPGLQKPGFRVCDHETRV